MTPKPKPRRKARVFHLWRDQVTINRNGQRWLATTCKLPAPCHLCGGLDAVEVLPRRPAK